ncbi:MAG: hypothetical protein M0P77_08285 [Firmicutes bacterium]|nr:hypothetical protein [Bacillota bacterium]
MNCLIDKLWNNKVEVHFFEEALRNFASPEQLFYSLNDGFFAYVPKNIDGEGKTLQSRNSLIGQFTEKWTKDLFTPIANAFNLYAVNGVVCEEIGLTNRSSADLALCSTDSVNQTAKNIKLIFEIKMSIVSNYKLNNNREISFIGDYKSHKGNPALLRSDSMLKAIGKSINIRVSGIESKKIPIIILGNSPITTNYIDKVDYLKKAGVIQGFWSLNPHPINSEHIRNTPNQGFITIDDAALLKNLIRKLLTNELNYFSSMISKQKLGQIIVIANKEVKNEKKAERFLQLINEV